MVKKILQRREEVLLVENSSGSKWLRETFCILYPVCTLYLICSLQFAFCTNRIRNNSWKGLDPLSAQHKPLTFVLHYLQGWLSSLPPWSILTMDHPMGAVHVPGPWIRWTTPNFQQEIAPVNIKIYWSSGGQGMNKNTDSYLLLTSLRVCLVTVG